MDLEVADSGKNGLSPYFLVGQSQCFLQACIWVLLVLTVSNKGSFCNIEHSRHDSSDSITSHITWEITSRLHIFVICTRRDNTKVDSHKVIDDDPHLYWNGSSLYSLLSFRSSYFFAPVSPFRFPSDLLPSWKYAVENICTIFAKKKEVWREMGFLTSWYARIQPRKSLLLALWETLWAKAALFELDWTKICWWCGSL